MLEVHSRLLSTDAAREVTHARQRTSRRLIDLVNFFKLTVGKRIEAYKAYGADKFMASESRLFDNRITLSVGIFGGKFAMIIDNR